MKEPGDSRVFAGGCLCGAVRYEAKGPLRSALGCQGDYYELDQATPQYPSVDYPSPGD